MRAIILSVMVFSLLLAAGCSQRETERQQLTIEGRWYTKGQHQLGRKVYTEYCARCHGPNGESIIKNWKRPNPDGSFPPPPLNGTGHTWHHPFEVLVRTVKQGGAPVGGTMPAFADSLKDEQVIAVIGFIQSMWNDKTYKRWVTMNADQ